MNPIKIFTDSTADIPIELRELYNISFIPLYVTIGGRSYKDQVDIDTAKLYRMVDQLGELPKTAAPSTQDFINSFTPWIDKGYDIIFIGISSHISATVQSANVAAQEFDEGRVSVVDSYNLSMGIGLIAMKAAEWASQGVSVEVILERIRGMVPKIRTSFIIDTLKYLHMGGRCTSIELIAGTVLKIRPQILMREGSLLVLDKHRGKKEKALKAFYTNFIGDGRGIDKSRIVLAHSADMPSAEYLKRKIVEDFNFENIYIAEAGTVISSHCGPGTVGIIYIQDEN